MTPNQILMKAGRTKGVLSMRHGKLHPVLQSIAQRHAKWQADNQSMGHAGWGARQIELVSRVPEAKGFAEVCCYSWPWNREVAQAAKDIFDTWEKSPGHWQYVNGRYDFWGYSMVQGRNEVWYACGIVAEKRTP